MPIIFTRCLRYLWAAPNTLLGVLFATAFILTGGRMQKVHGVLEISGGWITSRIAACSGYAAITLGHVVIGGCEAELAQLREHEHTHVRQAECWGPFFIPAYLLAGCWQWLHGRHAYHDNPFEKAAVAAHARQMQQLREGG